MINRASEDDLIPLLRAHGIRIAAYSPLAGGYLTGKLLPRDDSSMPPLSVLGHFDPSSPVSFIYTMQYMPTAAAVKELKAFVTSRGLTLPEVAYRWLQWHSALIPEDHGIIMGYSNIGQLESSIADW